MPSDDPRLPLALEALAPPLADFRAMLDASLTRAESLLAATEGDPAPRSARARAALGRFAEGRVRPDDFVRLTGLEGCPPLPPGEAVRQALATCCGVLRDALERGPGLFVGEVPAGGELAATVGAMLAEVGRIIGAARQAERMRSARPDAKAPIETPAPLPWSRWNRADRRLAPPLLVSIAGADLHPAGLADFCDGRAKFVLVVNGPCSPASLVRLITPGTFVLQNSTTAGLDRLAQYAGPAVAALVPEGAARFFHDPEKGKESWQRLQVDYLPEPPRKAQAGVSVWQQTEDLHQLAALAKCPAAKDAPAASNEADAVERLTAWLLAHADSP